MTLLINQTCTVILGNDLNFNAKFSQSSPEDWVWEEGRPPASFLPRHWPERVAT